MKVFRNFLSDAFVAEVAGLSLNEIASGAPCPTRRVCNQAQSARLVHGQRLRNITHHALTERVGQMEDRLADTREVSAVPGALDLDDTGEIVGSDDLYSVHHRAAFLRPANSAVLRVPGFQPLRLRYARGPGGPWYHHVGSRREHASSALIALRTLPVGGERRWH